MENMYYLMIKTIDQTGLKYLCKRKFNISDPEDPFKYKGSGKLWRRVLAKHPEYTISTVILGIYSKNDLVKYGTYYSELFNIVESRDWANLIIEKGDGGRTRSNTKAWINPVDGSVKYRTECPDGYLKYSPISNNKNTIVYHHPTTNEIIRLRDGDEVPEGFIKGNLRGRGYGPRKGKTKVYHNGKRKIYLKDGDEVPEGFVRGVHYTGTTSGRIGCHNPITLEKRYVNCEKDIPIGFIKGLFPTTGQSIKSPDGIVYKTINEAVERTGISRYKILKNKDWVILK